MQLSGTCEEGLGTQEEKEIVQSRDLSFQFEF